VKFLVEANGYEFTSTVYVWPVPGSLALFREVTDAVQVYLDMLYTGDAALTDAVFHERCHLCTLENGSPLFRSVAEYREILKGRKSLRPWGPRGRSTW
jgi:hypothetical protein